MNLQPLFDRVIVRQLADDESKGGIIVPEIARNNAPFAHGVVVAVGEGRYSIDGTKHLPMSVSIGDHVCYDRKAGAMMPWGDDEAVLLRETEIIGVLR